MTASRLLLSHAMRLRAAYVFVAAGLLGLASPVRADETVWTPFLFTPFCSTCGPQTPLTLEQADAVELLFGGSGVGPAIPLSPPVVSDDFTPPPSGGAVEGKPTLSLLPAASAAAGGLAIASSAGAENSRSGSTNAAGGDRHSDSDDQENAGGDEQSGLGYGVDVDQGSDSAENVVTFTSDDGISKDVVSNTSSGGGAEGQSLVPEPTTLLLFGSGLVLVSASLRKRRAQVRS